MVSKAVSLGVLVGLSLVTVEDSARAASCVPGFDYAIFVKDTISIQGNAGTDSWNSSLGTYAATVACDTAGDIGTNSTAGGSIHVQSNATSVCGDAYVGVGGNPNTAITGNGNILGSKGALTTSVSLPNVTVPSLSNGTPFSGTFNNANTTLAANRKYGAITCKNGSLTLSAGTYVFSDLSLTSNCQLKVGSGPISVYFTHGAYLQGGVIANSTGIPGNLVFYGGSAATDFQVQGGASAYFAVYAPAASCQVQGNADIYGAIVCDDSQVQGNAHIHYDKALQNYSGGGFACSVTTTEVSRSTPIIANAGTTLSEYLGTYEVLTPTPTVPTLASTATLANAQAWTFPFYKGHFRAVPVGSVSSTATVFSSLASPVFDAATLIPAATNAYSGTGCTRFSTSCRTVFTNVAGGAHPTRTIIQSSNATSVGALLGITNTSAQVEVLKRVVGLTSAGVSAPTLGGIDRSTAAVIESSSFAGSARPTIAYVAGMDGMLHAICASVQGACTALGRELWAFLPRTELPYIRTNTQLLNGSPRVDDMYGDFDGTGTTSWRTILTFQTGHSEAVYALDVTDPADPKIVWEYAVGVGLNVAMGRVKIGATSYNVVFAQTNNGSSSTAGTNVYAIDAELGTPIWQWNYAYPANRTGGTNVPASGIPGGVSAVDRNGSGYVTDVVFGSLYGSLFDLDATTGRSKYGTAPSANPCVSPSCKALYEFSTDYHPVGAPPTIFSQAGALFAAFVSGSYADNSGASGSGTTLVWSPATTNQYLIAVSLSTPSGSAPLTATSISSNVVLATNLGAGQRANSSATVSGDEIFVTTDSQNINDTAAYGTSSSSSGTVFRISLTTGNTTSSTSVAGGAGSVDAVAGTAYIASGQSTRSISAASTSGTSVEVSTPLSIQRKMWLSTGGN